MYGGLALSLCIRVVSQICSYTLLTMGIVLLTPLTTFTTGAIVGASIWYAAQHMGGTVDCDGMYSEHFMYSEHTRNKNRDGGRRSGQNKQQREKHEEGEARKRRDQKRKQQRTDQNQGGCCGHDPCHCPLQEALLPGFVHLADSCGFGDPKYYETIRVVSIGQKLYVFARGQGILFLASFNTTTNVWEMLPGFELFTDISGFGQPQYYETIRVITVGQKLYVFARGQGMLYLASFDALTKVWKLLPGFAHLTDSCGFGDPKYYETIRVVSIGQKLYVFARGQGILFLASFNTTTNVWEMLPGFELFTDISGFGQPQYYETIRVITVGQKLYVFARGQGMLYLASFDALTKVWELLPGFAHLTDSCGFGDPKYYETIRVVSIGQKLYVFARGQGILFLASFNTTTNVWEMLPGFELFTDISGFGQPQYYETIRVITVGQKLYVFARGQGMLYLASFDALTKVWELLPGFAHLTDSCGFGDPKYYETIRVVSIGQKLYVFSRGQGILFLASFNTTTNVWEMRCTWRASTR